VCRRLDGPRYFPPTLRSMVASPSAHSVVWPATPPLSPLGACKSRPGARCRTITLSSNHGSRTSGNITATPCFILPNRAGMIRPIGIRSRKERYASGTSAVLVGAYIAWRYSHSLRSAIPGAYGVNDRRNSPQGSHGCCIRRIPGKQHPADDHPSRSNAVEANNAHRDV
jgi:hypothetical protein